MKIELNEKYGKLLIVKQLDSYKSYSGNKMSSRKKFLAVCDCGNTRIVDNKLSTLKEKACVKCVMLTRPQSLKQENSYIRPYNLFLNSCIKRKINNELTLNNYTNIINNSCFYCGASPEIKKWDRCKFIGNGIDRFDNTKGYTIDNCVSCCTFCNVAKLDNSIDYFLNKIINIYDHLKLREISK